MLPPTAAAAAAPPPKIGVILSACVNIKVDLTDDETEDWTEAGGGCQGGGRHQSCSPRHDGHTSNSSAVVLAGDQGPQSLNINWTTEVITALVAWVHCWNNTWIIYSWICSINWTYTPSILLKYLKEYYHLPNISPTCCTRSA